MDGFEWLNIPRQSETGTSTSPAPPQVSFGFTSDLDLSSAQSQHANVFRSSSSDRINRDIDLYSNTNSGNLLIGGVDPLTGPDGIDDGSIPLSLTAQEMSLQEAKTYMRWYSDILTRTNSRTITLTDVYSFLVNFRIPESLKEKISKLFLKLALSINIGQFFALLRVISHVLSGRDPSRRLIKVMAPVPTPPSILSKKRTNDDYKDDDYHYENDQETTMDALNMSEPNKQLDLDGFTQFMLTGERPDERAPVKKRSKKLKSVKFSDQIISDIHQESASRAYSPNITTELDYSLPMDQLLEQVKKQQLQQKPDVEEQELLQEVESHMGHFKNLHSVDTMSVNGVPASLEVNKPLKPNRTGPNEMAQLLGDTNVAESPTKQQFLKPNMTGPAQMEQFLHGRENDSSTDFSNYFTTTANNNAMNNNIANNNNNESQGQLLYTGLGASPKISLLSFTSQMTGDTFNNTMRNSHVGDSSMNGTARPSMSSHLSFLTTQRTNGASPSPTRNGFTPPPPPVPSRRARSASTPMPNNRFLAFDGVNGHETSLYQGARIPLDPNQATGATLFDNSSANTNAGRPVPPVPHGATLFTGSHSNPSPSAGRPVPPPPPPSRRRVSNAQSPTPPPLPPKVHNNFAPSPTFGQPANSSPDLSAYGMNFQSTAPTSIYNTSHSNDSTTEILDDLKALQEEVDKIRSMTGGF